MKKRYNYTFVVYAYPDPVRFEIQAYTLKQAKAYFRLKHGKLRWTNIIRENLGETK